MDKVTISVIIPVYNRAHVIKRCIQSVIGQSFAASEIIVIDDASTDNLGELVKKLNIANLRLIKHKTNKGSQTARNTGIKNARSAWIAFLDSDDTWEPNKLELQVNALQKTGSDPFTLVHSDGYIIENGNEEKVKYRIPSVEGKNAFAKLLKHPGPAFPAILTSKIALEKIGLLDEKVKTHQEWDTSIRLAQICNLIHIRQPLFNWYTNNGDNISANKINHVKGYQYIIEKFESELKAMDNGYWWDNHLKALIVKTNRINDKKSSQNLISRFKNKKGIDYFMSKLAVRFKIKSDIYPNFLIKFLYRIWIRLH